uniref:Uncharacterized protein n=1 Tax=Panagrolaimus sp. PS1159 TaxID=55785 RepID=A0AC35GR04_9BILA
MPFNENESDEEEKENTIGNESNLNGSNVLAEVSDGSSNFTSTSSGESGARTSTSAAFGSSKNGSKSSCASYGSKNGSNTTSAASGGSINGRKSFSSVFIAPESRNIAGTLSTHRNQSEGTNGS